MSCAAVAAGGSDDGDEQRKGKETPHDDSNEPYYIWLKEFSAMIESLDLEYNPASPLNRKSTSSKLISHEYTSEDLEDPSVSRRKLGLGEPQTDKMVKKGRSRKQPKYKKLSELGSGTTAAVAPPPCRRGRPKKAAQGCGSGKNQPDGRSRGQEDESREWRDAAVEIGDVEETEMEVEHDKEKEIQELPNKVDKGSPKN